MIKANAAFSATGAEPFCARLARYFKYTAVFVNDTLVSDQNYSWFVAKIIDTINYNQPVIITTTAATTIPDFCKVFPNPFSGVITVNLKNKTAETKICVYDVLGKCVFDKVSKNDKEKIDLSGKPKGIYILEVESDGKNVMKKIVLQ
ncbi:MAG: T9SS type A sorting domain-containing protein [Bacteroidetes bacterium]|nr:T9SS type A sorting domain-containing protein [Bacteroidota bacterium]